MVRRLGTPALPHYRTSSSRVVDSRHGTGVNRPSFPSLFVVGYGKAVKTSGPVDPAGCLQVAEETLSKSVSDLQ